MYPPSKIDLNPQLPSGAQFWVPEPEDLEDDEGFAYFRDAWPITDISESEARRIVSTDRSLALFVSSLATTDVGFDAIAIAVETGSAEDIEGLSTKQLTKLPPYLTGTTALENLEIGLAGVVYCLAAAGMYPATSCRGHPIQPGPTFQ